MPHCRTTETSQGYPDSAEAARLSRIERKDAQKRYQG
jgi:hypothetical protein